ncbi:hypothetical protein [Rhodoferax fermentans]|uniref:Uncharacterized protein n=1 Tax=Rhodoferax fermentans TaxID=28066 RepID=A0A1T1AT47_RHOFE|nr:hypothetical protein [Rhodoferax fermentans]MBK1682269.1 hypothetical protein [Rhodoferax fermentans]OOV07276.1 hypothetical protein RF819_11525 [Rhodoferax fermentans]
MSLDTLHRPRTQLASRLAYGSLALLAGLAALWLAWHYPLGGALALGTLLALGAAMVRWPWLWLVLVPAALPLIGWAPWTGWLTFEEFDMLLLTAAAAGYGRLAYKPFMPLAQSNKGPGATKSGLLGGVLVSLLVLSVLWSMGRGFADAGGFVFGWFQGYHEPMNSLRLAKSLLLALLLWPLWRATLRWHAERGRTASADCHAGPRSGIHAVGSHGLLVTPAMTAVVHSGGASATALLAVGMALGLAGAALTTIWERLGFTGLLNFATDYRTTGLFWEMHVGGAALDGFLALTMPFAVWLLLVARRQLAVAGALVALGLGVYASLTTFSRGVYMALPVGVAVMLWLHMRQQARLPAQEFPAHGAPIYQAKAIWNGVVVVGLYAAAAAWWFPVGGYRGTLALMGTMLALLALGGLVQGLRAASWLQAGLLGTVLAAAALAAFAVVGKSSYVSYALGFVGTMAALGLALWQRRRARVGNWVAVVALACYGLTVLGAGLVYLNWGEGTELLRAPLVLGGLLLILPILGCAKKPLWPGTLVWQATVAGCMLMALTLVGVLSGGDYIGNRFETGRQDLRGRILHWQAGLKMLGDSDEAFMLGRGLGRYPASNLIDGPPEMRMGDYRVVQEADNAVLVLSGGHHTLASGAPLRFSQRIGLPQADAVLTVDVRADQDAVLGFEACPKHLLYAEYWACPSASLNVKGKANEWQHFELPMPTAKLSRGDWYAPRLLMFSVSVRSNVRVVELDNLHLRTTTGVELLANPGFDDGLAHWFFTSDRYHLPWHIKNLGMNLIFDQGWLGLLLFSALTAVVLWRVSVGAAKDHPLAPAIAGAVLSFGVVGLFDSLLDVPRVAFLFYLFLLIALSRPEVPRKFQ